MCAVIGLDAPTLPTERIKTKRGIYWRAASGSTDGVWSVKELLERAAA